MVNEMNLQIGRVCAVAVAGLIALAAAPVFATPAPLPLMTFQDVNEGANFKGNWPVGFADGPLTLGSGVTTGIFAGPGVDRIDMILLTVAVSPGTSPTEPIVLTLFEPGGAPMASIVLGGDDFFDYAATDFPTNIPGIGDGEVNGISFSGSLIAGIIFDPAALASASNGDLLASIGVATPVSLRVDLFGLATNSPVTIVGNAPNSHVLGVSPVPEPQAALTFLSGLLVVSLAVRRRARGAALVSIQS